MWLTPQVMLQLLAQRAAEISICLAVSPILLAAEVLHLAVWCNCSLAAASSSGPRIVAARNLLDRLTTLWAKMEEPT